MNRLHAPALIFFLALACAAPVCAELSRGSAFALPVSPEGEVSGDWLAQRTLHRSWGPSDDSIYVEVSVPGWRSEGKALALSALMPGSGQLYAGERAGLFFVAGEALGWFEAWYNRHRAQKIRGEARAYAGDPGDSLSRWSFSTYEQRTGRSSDDLRRIYEADRSLFYYLIGRDKTYDTGWEDYSLGYNASTRLRYLEIREDSEVRFKRSRYFMAALMVHHVVAALDAMRAARLHNLEISPQVHLGLEGGWSRGGPVLAAAIETRF